MGDLAEHRAVQAVAKSVLSALGPTISPEDTEQTIAARATTMLSDRGISDTWYYNCPAFVLLGSRSCLSISGREYKPSEETVGSTNLITVDLSPLLNGIWGDCARSFFVEDGAWTSTPSLQAFSQGAHAEIALHEAMQKFVTPRTSFEELFQFANVEIARLGFENLDFLGNVGHSIECTREARRYIEQGNLQLLGDAGLFTFEPHIRKRGERWGFKHENIYHFTEGGHAVEL
ncbi:MAG TPA: M24 family metallopeptidase [Solimonas sp.]|nr:M24 family metallopeptidase [Solimonas sp.]